MNKVRQVLHTPLLEQETEPTGFQDAYEEEPISLWNLIHVMLLDRLNGCTIVEVVSHATNEQEKEPFYFGSSGVKGNENELEDSDWLNLTDMCLGESTIDCIFKTN